MYEFHIVCTTHWQKLIVGQKAATDRDQGLLWPFVEPIYRSTICNSRELSASDTEGGTHRREAQYHLDIETNFH